MRRACPALITLISWLASLVSAAAFGADAAKHKPVHAVVFALLAIGWGIAARFAYDQIEPDR